MPSYIVVTTLAVVMPDAIVMLNTFVMSEALVMSTTIIMPILQSSSSPSSSLHPVAATSHQTRSTILLHHQSSRLHPPLQLSPPAHRPRVQHQHATPPM